MKILAVANQKGGVGKSTLVVHLAYAALESGLRVLLVDMDKQGNVSRPSRQPDDLPLKFTYEGEGEDPALAIRLMTLDGLASILAQHKLRANHG